MSIIEMLEERQEKQEKRKKFEYKVIYELPNKSFNEILNDLGIHGWEVIHLSNRPNNLTGHIVAKRELLNQNKDE